MQSKRFVWLLVSLAPASCGGIVVFDDGSGGAKAVGASTGTTKPTSATVGSTGVTKPTSTTVGSTGVSSATVGSTTSATVGSSVTAGSTSSTTAASTSATVGSSGSGVDCQALANDMQDAINAAAKCDINSPTPQCNIGSVMDDRCGCPTVVLNGTEPAKVMAAKAAYAAWTNAGCGPQACGMVCKPAKVALCTTIGGISWCVSD